MSISDVVILRTPAGTRVALSSVEVAFRLYPLGRAIALLLKYDSA
ncbi:hypothetical protein [Cylindrospermopsis raciborskii]|nr:hypothetical protein [Cylindrospermopsis raciborskii]